MIERYKKYTKNSSAPGGFMEKGEAKQKWSSTKPKQSTSDGYMTTQKEFNRKSPDMKNARKGYNEQMKADTGKTKRGAFKI